MKYEMVTLKNSYFLYSSPTTASSYISVFIPIGTTIIVTNRENGFCYNNGRWILEKDLRFIKDLEGNMGIYDYKADDSSTIFDNESETSNEDMNYNNINVAEFITEVENLFTLSNEYSTNTGFLKELRNTWGMPFQFLSYTDSRLSEMDFGRKYYENIVLNMPLLSIIPGKPVFMKGQTKETKASILAAIEDKSLDILKDSTIEEIMDGKYGQYYSFESDYVTYMNYVNRMCSQAAVYLGLGSKKAFNTNKTYRDFNWHSFEVNRGRFSNLQNTMGFNQMVTFFIDSSSGMSESASNDTGESSLAGTIQNVGDLVKEASFLFGPLSGTQIKGMAASNYEENIAKFADQYSNDSSGLIERLRSHADTLIMGANLLFPEIWRDSSYSKSYNVTIKLHSPYGDIESVFLNILVPFFHIMALCFPRQVPTSGAHGYVAPFLVRAYCRSLFNCNLGIVDSLSFTKAPNNEWTVDGLPTELEINLSIKDLYTALTIYGGDKASIFFSNTALVDFIGNICGINTYKKDLTRSIESYLAFFTNKYTNALPTVWRGLEESVKNKLFGDLFNF